MTLQQDLAETFQEVGSKVSIVGTSYRDEFIDSETSRRNTPFYKEMVLEASFKSTTNIEQSSIIKFKNIDTKYLVVDRRPELFENEIILYNAVLYMCNVEGSLKRMVEGSGSSFDSNYKRNYDFQLISGELAAPLAVTGFINSEMNESQIFINTQDKDKELYLPESVGARVDDRFEIDSNNYYRITNIEKHQFDAIDVCTVGEDTR